MCTGNEVLSDCCCLSTMHSSVMMWTDEGFACPIKQSYLLLGLEVRHFLFSKVLCEAQIIFISS